MAASTSVFQVMVPTESVNYILNPSAESTINFAATASATVTRSTTYSRQVTAEEQYSFRVQTSNNAHGVSLTTPALASATTYVSFWVRGTFANPSIKIGATTVTPTLYETDGAWCWYVNEAASFSGAQVSGQTAVVIQFDTGADCYVDHVVCQQGGWTTSFHGYFPGCEWGDIAHESISTLLAVTADGEPNLAAGTLYDLDDRTTLSVSSIIGAGLPDLEYRTINTADRGRIMVGASLGSRGMALTTRLLSTSTANLHSRRANLIDKVQPGDPFVLRYRGYATWRGGTADVWQIAATYAKGLEGSLTRPTGEPITLALTAYDPLFSPATETATALSTSTAIAAMGYCLKRSRGVWARPAAGTAPPGTVYNIAVSSRGHLFAACAGAVYGFVGGAWVSVGAVTGGSAFAYTLAFDPSETILYVGGNGTSFGGTAAANIAKYTLPATGLTGGTWAALGTGLGSTCRDLVVVPTTSGHTLYAFGEFTTAGGSSANYMATWNGSTWASVSPNTLNGAVWAAEKDAANNIYFAGAATNIGVVSASAPTPTITKVANGGAITGADSVKNFRYKIAGVYAGETAAGTASSNVQYLPTDGGQVSWSAMAGVYGYAVYREISAAGVWYYLAFTTGTTYYDDGSVDTDTTRTAPGSNGTGGKRVGYLNTATGAITAVTGRIVDSGAGTNAGLVGTVYSLALAGDNTTLYAGGAITAADGTTAAKAAQWTGGAWLPMGDGASGGDIRKMLMLPTGAVAVGGAFTSVGNTAKLGTASPYFASWLPGENGTGTWVNGDVVLPSSTVYALALDLNGALWLGSDSNGAATVGALTSVTAAGMGGGLLSYPRLYVRGPGLVRYIEDETTKQKLWCNLWVASGELVVFDLRRGFKVVQTTKGEPRLYWVLGGDLGAFGLRNGTNRLVCLMTSTDANTLVRVADPALGLSVDG